MANLTQDSTSNPSVGELVSDLSAQVSLLVRDELALAQREITAKGKKAGIGVGMFGAAGVLGAYAVGVFVAAAVIGLTHAVTAWLAAAIVGAALLAVSALLAFVGKRGVAASSPPIPEEALAGAQADVAALRKGLGR